MQADFEKLHRSTLTRINIEIYKKDYVNYSDELINSDASNDVIILLC